MYRLRFIADFVMPWVILGIGLLVQLQFSFKPILF